MTPSERKHTFKLTEREMRMIRIALETETERRDNGNIQRAQEYKSLLEYFDRRISDIV